ncbi:MAG: DUF3592 domain-containing protein [Acidobacteriota bacterium]
MLDSMLRFAPPPRPVPFSLSILNSLNAIAQIGWAVFGFGMIFFWGFVTNADFSFITFRGARSNTSGVVTRISDTSASEGKRRIRANHYQYSVAGRTFDGVSFSNRGEVSEGDRVNVEYRVDSPEQSRIEGQRRKMFSAGVAFVTIFPLIGLGLLIGAMRWGSRRARLLRDGVLTTGVLKAKRPTNTTVNNRRVFELDFEFTARDGRKHLAKARSSITDRLEDERQELLLYDPEKPEDAVLIDDAPSRPKLDETGGLAPRRVAAVLAMILPALVIAGNTLALMAKLG